VEEEWMQNVSTVVTEAAGSNNSATGRTQDTHEQQNLYKLAKDW